MNEIVQYEVRDHVAWATLNRPEVLNAIDGATLERLLAIVSDVASDEDVRVLIVTGNGRAFSAGGDIKDMVGLDEATFRAKAHLYQVLSKAMRQLDKPVLGAINGYALGGGLEIAMMCDLRVAAISAKLGLPDAQLGFSPTGGLTYLLTKAIGSARAMHMALTCEMIDAEEAERIGLVTRVVEDELLGDTVGSLALKMASWPAHGFAYNKRSFYMASEANFDTMLIIEEEYDAACFRSEATQRELAAFLDSRKK